MNQNDSERIFLFHTRKEDKTIEDFIKSQRLIGVSADEIFDDNKDFIYQQMSLADLEAYKEETGIVPSSGDDLVSSMTLPCPCEIKVSPYKVTAEILVENTNFQADNNDFYAFASEEIQEILDSSNYREESISKINCEVEVIGWFKQLNLFGDRRRRIKNVEEAWTNLSPYVVSLNTSVNANGGSFSLKLPIIGMSPEDIEDIFEDNFSVKIGNFSRNFKFLSGNRSLVHESLSSIWRGKEGVYAKKPLETSPLNLFSSLISYNDLLFFSFTKNEELKNISSLSEKAAKNNWDMIGLVDDVRVNLNANRGSGYVEIVGRDLMKLLIEDGSYFFNPSSVYSSESIFANESENYAHGDAADAGNNSGLVERLRNIMSEIDIFAYKPMRKLSYILKGVISQLTNIEVVPGELFENWQDKRTVWKSFSNEEK